MNLIENFANSGGGIGGARDLAPNHEIIGAISNGFRRSGHALLIALAGAGRSHTGRHQNGARAGERTNRAGFQRRSDDSIDTCLHRLANAQFHQFGGRAWVAEIGEVLLIETGEHRDREQFEREAPRPSTAARITAWNRAR